MTKNKKYCTNARCLEILNAPSMYGKYVQIAPIEEPDTDEKKKEVIDRILKAWVKVPHMRLGQLISNAFREDHFWALDYVLVRNIEYFVEHYDKEEDLEEAIREGIIRALKEASEEMERKIKE